MFLASSPFATDGTPSDFVSSQLPKKRQTSVMNANSIRIEKRGSHRLRVTVFTR